MRIQKGFTLIELMITVAIIGILAAIAYPSYNESILKGRRAQARTALLELMQQQERYMMQFNCYLPFTTSANFSATATAGCNGQSSSAPQTVPFKVFVGENKNSAVYKLEASTCSGLSLNECIQVTAIPMRNDPQVGNLTLTSNGIKSCSGTAASSNKSLCWP